MSPPIPTYLDRRPTPDEARALSQVDPGGALDELIEVAGELRDQGHGNLVSYSRKVFLPLTHLCRDICHYCVFAQPPKKGEAAYMPLDTVLDQARLAAAAGCKEALFTLGDKPELRYKAAREGLAELGHDTTLSYLREAAERVLTETGLLPHLNPGLMTRRGHRAPTPRVAVHGHHAGRASRRGCTRRARPTTAVPTRFRRDGWRHSGWPARRGYPSPPAS